MQFTKLTIVGTIALPLLLASCTSAPTAQKAVPGDDGLEKAIVTAATQTASTPPPTPVVVPAPTPVIPKLTPKASPVLNGAFRACPPGVGGWNIRSNASLQASIVFTAKCGAAITIYPPLNPESRWRKVTIDGLTGFTWAENVAMR